jgi:hypothetical protein
LFIYVGGENVFNIIFTRYIFFMRKYYKKQSAVECQLHSWIIHSVFGLASRMAYTTPHTP